MRSPGTRPDRTGIGVPFPPAVPFAAPPGRSSPESRAAYRRLERCQGCRYDEALTGTGGILTEPSSDDLERQLSEAEQMLIWNRLDTEPAGRLVDGHGAAILAVTHRFDTGRRFGGEQRGQE